MTRSKNQLILASQSPRRSELLLQAGFEFTVSSSQVSEIPDENLNLPEQIQDLASKKAQACLIMRKIPKGLGNLLLSADTVVVLDGQILGKPMDRQENRQQLTRLSGRKHSVITGVCLLDVDSGREVCAHQISDVFFREVSSDEIDAYVASGDGLDKAGGYGIQGEAGKFVEKLVGPMDNVIGLPIKLVEELLRKNDWSVDRR